MSEDVHGKAGAGWRACWRVVERPAPEVVLALPVECLSRHDAFHPVRHSSSPVLVEDRVYIVRWIGWSPSMGLAQAMADWLPRKGKPSAPASGWTPWQRPSSVKGLFLPARKSDLERRPRLLRFQHLPCPSWAGQVHDRSQDQLYGLEQANMRAFLVRMPSGVLEAYDALSERTSSIDNPWSFQGTDAEERILFLLGGGAEQGVDPMEAGRRRVQFVLSHTAFCSLAFGADFYPRIDRGDEGVAMISEKLRCPARLVRALSKVTMESDATAFLHARWCLPLLEGMAPSWLAELSELSADGWGALRGLADIWCPESARYMTLLGGLEPTNGNRSFRTAMRQVGASLAPERPGGLSWIAATGPSWAHFEDMVMDMARELVLPALARSNPKAAILAATKLTIREALLCHGAGRLHRALAAHLAGVVHDARLGLPVDARDAAIGWGEAAPETRAPSGPVLRFLPSQVELDAEGRALEHCVASYGRQCASRACAILSLGCWSGGKAAIWKPSSTAEIVACSQGKNGTLGIEVRQHYGHGNGSPPAEDVMALRWWLAEVEAGRVRIAPGALRLAPKGAMIAANLPELLGEAWDTPGAHAHRWDRWRRLLGTRSRCFGDWLLSLPSEFMAASPRNEALVAQAVDMDEEMRIASLIAVQEAVTLGRRA